MSFLTVGSGRGTEIVRLLLRYGFAIGLIVILLGFGLKFRESSEREQVFKLPLPTNESQERSARLMDWWRSNNQKLLSEKGELNSARYLTVWSQHFQRGRVIYNHVDGWALITGGTTKSFRKVVTPGDELITSGPGNSTIEKEVLKRYLLEYSSEEQKGRIKKLIKERKLLGGIGTLFIRDYLYRELGWPIGEEYLEREVIFGEATDYLVFIGLQNRPGDNETECAIWFDESNGQYTKQTNSSHLGMSR